MVQDPEHTLHSHDDSGIHADAGQDDGLVLLRNEYLVDSQEQETHHGVRSQPLPHKLYIGPIIAVLLLTGLSCGILLDTLGPPGDIVDIAKGIYHRSVGVGSLVVQVG